MELKRINQICEVNPKQSEISNLPDDLIVSFVPMEDVPLPRIEFKPYKTKSLGEVRKKYTYFRDSDIILAKVTPCFENGKIAIANDLNNGIGFGSSELYVLRCSDKIDNKYLFYILQSNEFLQEGTNTLSGTSGLLRVPRKFIEEYEIPLPSLEIQKQIVTECQAVETRQRELLTRNLAEKEQLKSLRESLLNKAISGQLVPQIEAEGSGEELYEQIRAQKNTPSASRPPLTRGISPVSPVDIPFTIPKSWKWVRLGEIIHVKSGDFLSSKMATQTGNLPVYGGNGVNGHHDKSNVTEETITIGRVGYYCGAVHLTPQNAWVTDNALIVSYPKNLMDRAYLILCLKNLNLARSNNSTAQPVISGAKIYPIPFPLPPLAEQARIVSAVELEMAKIQSLEVLNQENHTLISKMLNQFIRERIG